MKIKNSSVHTSLSSKDGKTYANVLVTLLSDSGRMREIELDVPTPVEDWEKVDYQKNVESKYKGNKPHTNVPSDGVKKKVSNI